METTPLCLLEIRQKLPEFSGNNRVIAERIVQFPELVMQEKVSEFAMRCHCDNAQVVRLCQKLGYDGFTALKKRIAGDLWNSKRTLRRQIPAPGNSFEQWKANISSDFIRTVNDTIGNLTESLLLQAAGLLRKARRIMICGFGASGLAARNLQLKLLKIGFYAMFFEDAENVKTACATLTAEDLLIVISFSGNTGAVLDAIEIVRKTPVPVLALTNYLRSELGQCAACVLPTTADEQRLRLGAMDSVNAQFLVINLLCSWIAMESPQKTEERILQIFKLTQENR